MIYDECKICGNEINLDIPVNDKNAEKILFDYLDGNEIKRSDVTNVLKTIDPKIISDGFDVYFLKLIDLQDKVLSEKVEECPESENKMAYAMLRSIKGAAMHSFKRNGASKELQEILQHDKDSLLEVAEAIKSDSSKIELLTDDLYIHLASVVILGLMLHYGINSECPECKSNQVYSIPETRLDDMLKPYIKEQMQKIHSNMPQFEEGKLTFFRVSA